MRLKHVLCSSNSLKVITDSCHSKGIVVGEMRYLVNRLEHSITMVAVLFPNNPFQFDNSIDNTFISNTQIFD